MDMAVFTTLFCLYLTIQVHYLAQGCINEYSNSGSYLTLSKNRRHQAIIPSYRLNCSGMCGSIIDWEIYADRRRRRETDELTRDSDRSAPAVPSPLLGIQVWRPVPPLDESTGTGCYSLVGSQGISSINIPDGDSDNDGGSNSNILTPSERCDIPFQPGDVLGFYVDIPDDDMYDDGIRIRRAPGNKMVWYTEDNIASSYLIVGNNPPADLVTSTMIAPAISISITAYPCAGPSLSTSTLITSLSSPTVSVSAGSISPSITLSSITMTTVSPLTTQAPRPTNDPLLPMPSNIGIDNGILISPRPTVDPIGPDDSIADTVTTDPLRPIEVSESNNLGELVAGAIVAFLAVLVLAVLLIITIVFIFKRRVGKRMDTSGVIHTTIGFSNQNYARLDNEFETSYESVDASPEPAVPAPRIRYSPASETELPQESESNPVRSEVYHTIGPSISNLPNLTSAGTDNQSDHTYQYIEAGTIGIESNNIIYKDPNQPNSGGAKYSEVNPTDVFGSTWIYVPTLEERSSLEGHYDMQDISCNKIIVYHKASQVYNRLKFFEEEKIYWAPASTASELYSQLASMKYREIPRKQVRILNQLGSGQFGEVCKAVWSISGTTKELAIKTLRAELPEEEKVRFLQEAAIMGQFSHPNVVKLYGVVTVGDPMMICLELMANGDLRCHLSSLNPHAWNSKELEVQFLQFSKQITAGMEYLANKSFIHRDLAARNILLDQTLTCKIGDFGMARDLMNETYYTAQSKGAKIPIKWTAPEALFYKKYSTNSDVWSYGMVLFEIWSVGKKPFSQFSNSDVLRQINAGYNQPPPPGCPRAIYQLMVDCWHPVHSQRPPFNEISHYLSTSSDTLLEWREDLEDEANISLKARKLGAPLAEAEDMYKDLQEAYLQLENLLMDN